MDVPRYQDAVISRGCKAAHNNEIYNYRSETSVRWSTTLILCLPELFYVIFFKIGLLLNAPQARRLPPAVLTKVFLDLECD